MRLPNSAADPIIAVDADYEKESIRNPYFGKEQLSILEAYDLISIVSAQVYADAIHRYSQEKHQESV